ncbi:hypothetical protein LQE92_07555 [Lacrimispora sp. NSJ-141]|uniref:Uncharacterized protein n=1 Tax=Lientehia hominis TaxID=2897778 RepID=A0AAP2RIR1_9FIRM|nr:hypothetical protein [Lientehia hominis]MCD2492486.1 hypothetical protein [Lientehia hominis]
MSDYRTGVTTELNKLIEIDKLQQQLDKFSSQSFKIKLDFDTKGIDFNNLKKTFFKLGQQAYDSYSSGLQTAGSTNDIYSLLNIINKLPKETRRISTLFEDQSPIQIHQNSSLQNAGERF